jgi:hypothetical protein
MIVEGVRLAVSARDMSRAWDSEYELLLRRTYEAQEAAEREIAALHDLGDRYDTAFRDLVLPRLADLTANLGNGHPGHVLADLADLTELYAGTPMFATMATFETFMAKPTSVLVLDLGHERNVRRTR